jgi:hypothetical protein
MSDELGELMQQAGAKPMNETSKVVENQEKNTEQNTQKNTQNANSNATSQEVKKPDVANQTSTAAGENANTNTSSETNVGQDDIFKIDRFNKEIGRDFKSVDEVRGLLERADKAGKLEEQFNSLKEIYSKTTKPWANDEVRKLNEIYNKNPDVPKNVVNALASENLDEMSPKDLLIWKHRLENPNDSVDNSKLSKFIDMNYGLNSKEPDFEDDSQKGEYQDQQDYNQHRLNTDANKFRQELKSKFDVEIPADVDIDEVINNFKLDKESSINDRKQKFEPIVDGLTKDFNNFKITDPNNNEVLVDVAIDEKFKEGLPGFMMKTAIDQGLDPANLQDIAKLKKLVSDVYFVNNKYAIFKKFASDIETRMKDSQYNEQHNIQGTKTYTQNAPAGDVKASRVGTKEQVNAEIAKDLRINK